MILLNAVAAASNALLELSRIPQSMRKHLLARTTMRKGFVAQPSKFAN
jgi:hypothetical protein